MKRKILKLIAIFTVHFRMNGHNYYAREARLSIIQYSIQKLENPFLNTEE